MTTHRLDVEFHSDGTRCRAWLYLPDNAKPAPVIVMAHGLGSVRTMRLDAYAERFSTAGYACLVFDYRHFGDSDGEPRQVVDVNKQLQDWKAAIVFARGRSDVDAGRVILWGTSFSGGHVIAVADHTVKAVVVQCPFTSGLASSFAVAPVTSIRISIAALRDVIGSWLGTAPVTVALVGKPGSMALMSAPDCESGYLRLIPDEERGRFRNAVAARIALQLFFYAPGKRVAHLDCPVLFCVCASDTVAPSGATLRHARRARKGEIRIYQEGHFDIYTGEAFERVTGDQIGFLSRTVPVI
ncbi:alpha/beta hydrolase [Pararhizobium sp.]|uniref:alpha/beta hydrolase n=1 Tax=Pararhizobium sp. TaxID=1977563 RepID=UPI003BA85C3C